MMTVVSALGALVIGCSGDSSGTGPVSAKTTFFNVRLNQHAIDLALTAPVNKVQLTLTPVNALGESVANTGHVSWSAYDSSITVDSTGLVTAQYTTSTSGTLVIASLRQGNLTLADTAYVQVTATAPSPGIKTFSIQPVNGDSAIRAVGDGYVPTVTATDSLGGSLAFNTYMTVGSDAFYWVRSSNPAKAFINHRYGTSGNIGTVDTGRVVLYASAWFYGVAVQDSLPFVIGWKTYVTNYQDETTCGWYRCDIFVGVGGQISWGNYGSDAMEIDFVDSTGIDSAADPGFGISYTGAGNMHFPANAPGTAFSRRFTIAKTYHYYNGLHPSMTGTIYVLNNPK